MSTGLVSSFNNCIPPKKTFYIIEPTPVTRLQKVINRLNIALNNRLNNNVCI